MSGAKLVILTYHRVLERHDPLRPYEPDVTEFERHMRMIARFFRVLPLAEAVQRLHEGTLPRGATAITFDDGYADNYEVALPVLAHLGLPATFFVATGFLDGGCMWNDAIIETVRAARGERLAVAGFAPEELPLGPPEQRERTATRIIDRWKYLPLSQRSQQVQALCERAGVEPPRDLMMSTAQVRALSAQGMEVGAHTITHPILERLGDAEADAEITGSKRELEAITGAPVRLFAYPNGRPGRDYGARHAAMVKAAGFTAAVSTHGAPARADDDPFQLPRLAPWDRSAFKFLMRLWRWRIEPFNGPRAAEVAA